jgi:hypothetical protein
MFNKEIGQFFNACITEITVSITPLAVFFVEKSIRLFTGVAVLKRHTAALTDKILGRAEKCID